MIETEKYTKERIKTNPALPRGGWKSPAQFKSYPGGPNLSYFLISEQAEHPRTPIQTIFTAQSTFHTSIKKTISPQPMFPPFPTHFYAEKPFFTALLSCTPSLSKGVCSYLQNLFAMSFGTRKTHCSIKKTTKVKLNIHALPLSLSQTKDTSKITSTCFMVLDNVKYDKRVIPISMPFFMWKWVIHLFKTN